MIYLHRLALGEDTDKRPGLHFGFKPLPFPRRNTFLCWWVSPIEREVRNRPHEFSWSYMDGAVRSVWGVMFRPRRWGGDGPSYFRSMRWEAITRTDRLMPMDANQ